MEPRALEFRLALSALQDSHATRLFDSVLQTSEFFAQCEDFVGDQVLSLSPGFAGEMAG